MKGKGQLKGFIKYFKPHKKLFFLDVFCAILVAVCNLFYPYIARKIQYHFVPLQKFTPIVVWLGVLLAVFAVKALLTYVVSFYGHVFGIKVQGDMRRDLFKKLQDLPVSYFDENKTGVIMSRVVNDLFEVSELAHHGPEDLLISVISIIGALILIGTMNLYLCLIVTCVVPLIVLVVVLSRKKMLADMIESRVKTAVVNASVENSVSGIRVSKIFTAEQSELNKFDFSNEQFKNARKTLMNTVAKFHTLMTFVVDFLYLVTLASGVVFFFYGKISASDLTAFLLYIVMMIDPIKKFQVLFEELQNGFSGLKRFNEVMDIPTENFNENGIDISDIKSIEFKNVSFKYPNTEKYVLKDFSFKCEKGKTVAIVGESGGGKTTVTNLILYFYKVESGEILVNGISLDKINIRSLRQCVGVVQQDVFLFDDTVRENILFGRHGASLPEIEDCAKKADLHDFILTLPKGYDTQVGERGVKLSGGQKQKISIARAFLKDPSLLILDEATSSLDRFSEIEIQTSLNNLSKDRTNVIIAHRLSTVKSADEIIVIANGKVAESGTHEDLIEKRGIYYDLYTKSE